MAMLVYRSVTRWDGCSATQLENSCAIDVILDYAKHLFLGGVNFLENPSLKPPEPQKKNL